MESYPFRRYGATILACFFLGEKLHLCHVAGGALIASGIAIVMLVKKKAPNRSDAAGS